MFCSLPLSGKSHSQIKMHYSALSCVALGGLFTPPEGYSQAPVIGGLFVTTDGLFAGGPFIGGPFAGEPFAGEPFAGGPFAGGPFVGGPFVGGLFAEGPFARGLWFDPSFGPALVLLHLLLLALTHWTAHSQLGSICWLGHCEPIQTGQCSHCSGIDVI